MQWMSARNCLLFLLIVTALALMLSACVVYEPYYYPGSQYDRVWGSAIRAAEDVGIAISSADRSSGIILGGKGSVDVTISVQTQTDGRIKMQLNIRGPEGAEPYLTERFYQAYDRYMGR